MNYIDSLCAKAKKASKSLTTIGTEAKNQALLTIAADLEANEAKILEGNKKDVQKGIESGMNKGLIDRLTLTGERIALIAEGVRQVASLPDPVGEIISMKASAAWCGRCDI